MSKLLYEEIIEYSALVDPLTQIEVEYSPTNGRKIRSVQFIAEAGFDPNISVSAVWDYQGQNEDYYWSTNGSASYSSPKDHGICNGEKITLILDNSSLIPTNLSGFLKIQEWENV